MRRGLRYHCGVSPNVRRFLPLIVTVVLAGIFLVIARVEHFNYGLRTYWPVFVVVYCIVRLGVES